MSTIPATTSPGAAVTPTVRHALDAACDVSALASTDSDRFGLRCVAISRGHAVATNGHVLLAVPLLNPGAPDVPDVLVPAKALGQAIRANKADGVTVDMDARTMSGPLATMPTPPSEDGGSFPRWERVIPDGEPESIVMLDAELLAAVLAHARKHAKPSGRKSKARPVVMTLRGKANAACLSYQTEDGRTVRAVIMPMRMD